jgi:hypothetical protein
MDLIHQRGANAFFAAVRQTVAVGDVIHVAEPPLASLIAGVTGRWTTSGILRDVRSSAPASPPDQCDYLVLAREMGGPPGPPMPGRERPQRFRPDPPPGFEKVFANEFGSLWRNPSPPEHLRAPAPAVLSLPRLAGLAAVALGLVVVDLLRRPSRTARWLVPLLGALMVAVCLWPLVQTAARELTHPPTPPPRPELPGLTMDHHAMGRQHERVLQAVKRLVNDGKDAPQQKHARRRSPDPAAAADRRSSPTFSDGLEVEARHTWRAAEPSKSAPRVGTNNAQVGEKLNGWTAEPAADEFQHPAAGVKGEVGRGSGLRAARTSAPRAGAPVRKADQ